MTYWAPDSKTLYTVYCMIPCIILMYYLYYYFYYMFTIKIFHPKFYRKMFKLPHRAQMLLQGWWNIMDQFIVLHRLIIVLYFSAMLTYCSVESVYRQNWSLFQLTVCLLTSIEHVYVILFWRFFSLRSDH